MTMSRKPQQDRSTLSMARMLDAAEALFAEGGDNALTVEAVVTRAKTSVGSFYGRFDDRDGLLQAMHERFLLRLGGAAHVAVAAAGNEKTLAGALEVFLSHLFTAAHEYRNSARFFVLHRSADPNLRAQGIRANAVFAGIFTTLMLSHREEIAHASSATAIDVAWRMLYAALAQQMMFDGEEVSGVPMTIPALVREITGCLAAYLEAPPVKSPPVNAAPVKAAPVKAARAKR
jgi:AcrR family transcriptional regulator